MKIERLKGETYLIKTGSMAIPFYHIGSGRVVLMDSGLAVEGEKILDTLHMAGFWIEGILTSHAHYDHVGNHNRFRASDGAQIWASEFDAATMRSALTLQATFCNERIENIQKEYGYMVCQTDHIFYSDQTQLELSNARFKMIPLPGHAHSHTGFITPDGVAYLGDLMLGRAPLASAKLLYALCWQQAVQSIEKACGLQCQCFVLAHGGVVQDLNALAKANVQTLRQQMDVVMSCMTEWASLQQIMEHAIIKLGIYDRKPGGLRVFERSVHAFIDYLIQLKEVEETVQQAGLYYRRRNA